MSAAEKLKALENMPRDHAERLLDFALPQIVALVEAAQAVESQCVAPALYKELTALLAALTALDEALT